MADWSSTAVNRPADWIRIAATGETPPAGIPAGQPAVVRRAYRLNMPQMALGGMSESWLFKEIGDIHWSIITTALGMPSSRLTDGSGNRLYATFTRLRLISTASLAAYTENESITINAHGSRYSAGMFFTEAMIEGEGRSAQAEVMSTFSKLGEGGANRSLVKGQPEIPPGFSIPTLSDMPEFATEYRTRRELRPEPPIFECEYDIIPCHDINGVGLLYFAAYPIINDICAMRYAGRSIMEDFATRERDVLYFANCDPNETLIYRIHRWRAAGDRIEIEESLSRKGDGVRMAHTVTVKDRRHSRQA